MSAIRTLILGILNDGVARHGYEVRQILESWNAEKWANIGYGSIYSALKKMEDEGLLTVVEQPRKAGQLERVVYQITKSGSNYFLDLLRKYWWTINPTIDPFQVAITFMDYMSKDELLLALDHRADSLRLMIKSFERSIPLRMQNIKAPRHIVENFNLVLGHYQAELSWIESAIEKVKRDELP